MFSIVFRMIFTAIGFYLNVDGWYSIYRYWNSDGPNGKQKGLSIDNLVRVIRASVGIFLIVVSWLI